MDTYMYYIVCFIKMEINIKVVIMKIKKFIKEKNQYMKLEIKHSKKYTLCWEGIYAEGKYLITHEGKLI